MKNNNKNLVERLDDLNMRISGIVHVAVMSSDFGCGTSDPLSEFFDDIDHSTVGNLEEELPFLFDLFSSIEQDGFDSEFVFNQFYKNDALGFFVKAEQPHLVLRGPDVAYSWGYTQSRWFYGNTYEVALFKAMDWGKSEQATILSIKKCAAAAHALTH